MIQLRPTDAFLSMEEAEERGPLASLLLATVTFAASVPLALPVVSPKVLAGTTAGLILMAAGLLFGMVQVGLPRRPAASLLLTAAIQVLASLTVVFACLGVLDAVALPFLAPLVALILGFCQVAYLGWPRWQVQLVAPLQTILFLLAVMPLAAHQLEAMRSAI